MKSLPKVLKRYQVVMSNLPDNLYMSWGVGAISDSLERTRKDTVQDKAETSELKYTHDQMLKNVVDKAESIIKAAEENAKKILESAKTKAETERMSAQDLGYEAGLKLGREKACQENMDVMNEILEFLRFIEKQKDSILKAHEEEIRDLAINIARKIIRTELDTKSSTFLDIYKNAVQEIRDQEWIKVSVSGCEAEFATSNSDLLLSYVKGTKHIEIETLDAASRGTCIVETPQGIIDASVETQLKKLRKAFIDVEPAV